MKSTAKNAVSVLMAAVMLMLASAAALAEEKIPDIYINGVKQAYSAVPYYDGEALMVPFAETMNALGIEASYDEEEKRWEAVIGDFEMDITPDTNSAVYDLVPFELDHINKSVGNDVMTELDFIGKIYELTMTQNGGKIYITYTPEAAGEEFDVEAYFASYPVQNVVLDMDDMISLEANIGENDQRVTKVIEVDDNPNFDKAISFESKVKLVRGYDVQIGVPSKTECAVGDICSVEFWARCAKTADESGMGILDITFEKNSPDWDKDINGMCPAPGGSWRHYKYYFEVLNYHAAGEAQFGWRVGYQYQTLELAGLKIINYGRGVDTTNVPLTRTPADESDGSVYATSLETYYGREDGALWREEALKRIEKYRVRDINVNVTDENGTPVEGADVKADMTRSEFHWGTLIEARFMTEHTQMSKYFADTFLQQFNTATLNVMNFSGYYGTSNQQSITPWVANFLRENDIDVRYHNLIWDGTNFMDSYIDQYPVDYDSMTEEELIKMYAGHASRMLYTYGDIFYEMDVLNEPLAWDLYYKKFGAEWIAKVMLIVRDICDDVNPDIKLLINDGVNGNIENWDKAYDLRGCIDDYLENGAKLDGCGFESHFTTGVYPQLIYNQMDYVAQGFPNMSMTEYDFTPELTDREAAAELEKDFFEDLLIMSYSHPKMTSFIMWGHTDFWHWSGNSPLYDSQYNPKPCLAIWEKYTKDEWWTNTGAKSDENGSAAMRGHRGNYDITVTVNGKTAKTTLVVSDTGENTVNAVVKSDGTIELASSEEVNRRERTRRNYLMEGRTSEYELTHMWEKLYENKLADIKFSDGTELDFLAGENGGAHSVKPGEYITASAEEPIENGYVSVTIPDSKTLGVCSVYGSGDGTEWEFIGNFGSGDDKYIGFNGTYKSFKITPANDKETTITNIHVSRKEPKL
ncbi:MAG TPA: endo-1,4-beta-xylanase [Candidatus Ornithomonoglobus intestinigallinarum]|uniref:endo-1,4-beta-xylanase n=1 Tax=Candidatus Ornithomonoglobus intestinigallinarum TaxID=2840894 RepID=A0A9D1KPV0_9FIRM|nr:endo-1,4-beta-xylanase [Candidatus Ornithomonoglobus intestinigallinarum]